MKFFKGPTSASSEETYSYINRTYGKATFQQVYKILKYDISPIQRAKLTVNIPTSVAINGKEVKFLSLYAPEGSLAGQSITCQSSIDTIMDNNVPVVVGDGDKKKRKRREVSTVDEQLSKYPANRTIYFNCSSESVQEGTVCGSVTCDFGPLKNIKNTAEIRFKMILDISELTDYKPDKDIVIVSTSGTAQIVDNVVSSGGYSHEVSVPSVFIGPSAEQSIAIWIIIVAVICGILLLALLAGGLYKLGFFKREKKAMLMEEKAKQNAEDTAEPLTTGAQT
ncbi:hypothetical protein QE152_g37239 [Popillia japonica]|uniref:Uncharacterized protein n=1 Tax=Popillia japonica TaxID=7064 RepID=A0AAW1IAT9_POPJA